MAREKIEIAKTVFYDIVAAIDEINTYYTNIHNTPFLCEYPEWIEIDGLVFDTLEWQ